MNKRKRYPYAYDKRQKSSNTLTVKEFLGVVGLIVGLAWVVYMVLTANWSV